MPSLLRRFWLPPCSILVDLYDPCTHGLLPCISGQRMFVMVLVDYGVSGSSTVCNPTMKTKVGTAGWSPPEYLQPQTRYTNAWDTWGLGLLCLLCNSGSSPVLPMGSDAEEYQVSGVDAVAARAAAPLGGSCTAR